MDIASALIVSLEHITALCLREMAYIIAVGITTKYSELVFAIYLWRREAMRLDRLTDNQLYAHLWLSRMWDVDNKVKSYEKRKADIISSLSGIGKYDDEFIPSQTGENLTETKNIEYSTLCQEIEKLTMELSVENVRTMQIINSVKSAKLSGMLFDRYINRMSWNSIGNKYHYTDRHSYNYMHKSLDAVYQFIPKGEVEL